MRWIAIALISTLLPSAAYPTTRVTAEGIGFLTSPESPVERYEGRLQVEYERNFKLSRRLQLRLRPFVQITSLPDAWHDPIFFDPKEANLSFRYGTQYLRAGFFTQAWEGTDGVNPMDIASMKNWGDPFSSLSKASAGIQAGKSFGNVEIEASWIPQQTKSDLPGEESAWLPRRFALPTQNENIELRLPAQMEYEYDDREELNSARKNNYAARVQAHTDMADLSLGFYEGVADMPILQPTLNVTPIEVSPKEIYQLQSPTRITPIDYKRRTAAGVMTIPLQEWIIRIAARYDQPLSQDPRVPTWSQQTVAGFERSFNLGENQWTGIAQFVWYHRPESSGIMSVSDVFDESTLLGLRAPLSDDWTMLLAGMINTKGGGWFSQTSVSYRITDRLQSETYLHLLDGPPESLLGIMGENDRLGLRMTYVF